MFTRLRLKDAINIYRIRYWFCLEICNNIFHRIDIVVVVATPLLVIS